MAAKLLSRATKSQQDITKEAVEILSTNIPGYLKPSIEMMIELYKNKFQSDNPIDDNGIEEEQDDEDDDRMYLNGLTKMQFEICHQIFAICNKQCEATQWLTKWDIPILKDILNISARFGNLELLKWKASGLRRSIFHLVESSVVPLEDGEYQLHETVVALLKGMVERVESILEAVKDKHSRELLDEDKRKPYDPSTGVAYSFSSSGAQLYEWPNWSGVSKSEKPDCDCKKPDWMKTTKSGMSEGVLTFMCLKSNTVIGTTFLTAHEGQKDAAAAIYSYFEHLRGLVSVVCDTPCMHASYLMTRAPRDFAGVKFTADRFHGRTHTCFEIYDANEYDVYDHVNTSLIEQHHSVIDCLTTTFKSTTLSHAMFLLQTLHQDIYDAKSHELGATEANTHWPTHIPTE
jgi:hypothetical protein